MKKYLVLLMISVPVINAFRLTRVILSTNEHPTYIQFWPLTSLMWHRVVGLRPTLALIDYDTTRLKTGVGDVVRFKPLAGIPTSFQAQVVRLLLPALYPDDYCIISDIDMIPLQRDYFINGSLKAHSNQFVVYRDKAYGENYPQYPMCYLAAQGKVFAELFNVHSKKDIKRIIREWYALGIGWTADERILYRTLHKWPHFASRCVLLGEGVGPRIDRMDWSYDPAKLRTNGYIDAHMLRPYKKYKAQIDQLIRDRLS